MQAIGLVPSSTTPISQNTPLFVPNFNPSLIGQPTPAFLPFVAQTFRISYRGYGEGRRELERKVCPSVSRENSSSPVIAVQPLERVRFVYIERKKGEERAMPICFIRSGRSIVFLIDRSSESIRISRDLKYSFNETLADAC